MKYIRMTPNGDLDDNKFFGICEILSCNFNTDYAEPKYGYKLGDFSWYERYLTHQWLRR